LEAVVIADTWLRLSGDRWVPAEDDPQLAAYYRGTYAYIARSVDLAMRHMERPCVGVVCDLDAPCPRHERTGEVVQRYLRRYQ
jgi:hypothetical protein